MIRVTPAAARQISESARQSGLAGLALRIEVTIAGDGSFQYAMGFDDTGSGDGLRSTSEGIDLVIAPGSEAQLAELTIDYVQLDSGEFAFIFVNPRDPQYQPPHKR